MTVPVIDVAPYLRGGRGDKRKVAREIASACEESGFFCIVGHGVSAGLAAETRQVAADFFALPDTEKRLLRQDGNTPVRGYFPFAGESGADRPKMAVSPDLHEAYAMGPPDVPDDPYHREQAGRYFFAENLYPAKPEGFRDTVNNYFRAMHDLSNQLMRAMALALELGEEGFADRLDRPACVMRLIRYPAQTSAPAGRQMRFHAHTDYGTLTVLRGDDVPGTLQIKLPRAGWTDLRPPEDAFACNLGDTMARWTGGRWKSTMHRVANPPAGAAQRDRISLVFFHQPNYDILLKEVAGTRWHYS